MLELCFAVTMHLGLPGDWNDYHPCIRYVDDITIGAYYNSEATISYCISDTFEYEKWFLEAGLVTGYSGAEVLPMVRFGYEIIDHVLFFASPAYAYETLGVTVGIEIN